MIIPSPKLFAEITNSYAGFCIQYYTMYNDIPMEDKRLAIGYIDLCGKSITIKKYQNLKHAHEFY